MNVETLLDNIMHPPVLFFFLGLLAIFFKSDLEVPPAIGKFLSLYLLFDIGIKGGEELFHHGFSPMVIKILLVCIAASFIMPFITYRILRFKLDIYNAGAIAATYGSISAVTFATTVSFLESQGIGFQGYMVAGMALMESPAIIAGLILIRLSIASEMKKEGITDPEHANNRRMWKETLHEAFFNGSVFLLVGSLVIGYASGAEGEKELQTFVSGIFKGMLSLYMLDMGLLAGRRINELKQSGLFLSLFALLYPIFASFVGIGIAFALGLAEGDALLMTILIASASYIAVPAAMRMAVPQANMSLLLPMSLGITFTFNVAFGIPLYFSIIKLIW